MKCCYNYRFWIGTLENGCDKAGEVVKEERKQLHTNKLFSARSRALVSGSSARSNSPSSEGLGGCCIDGSVLRTNVLCFTRKCVQYLVESFCLHTVQWSYNSWYVALKFLFSGFPYHLNPTPGACVGRRATESIVLSIVEHQPKTRDLSEASSRNCALVTLSVLFGSSSPPTTSCHPMWQECYNSRTTSQETSTRQKWKANEKDKQSQTGVTASRSQNEHEWETKYSGLLTLHKETMEDVWRVEFTTCRREAGDNQSQ